MCVRERSIAHHSYYIYSAEKKAMLIGLEKNISEGGMRIGKYFKTWVIDLFPKQKVVH